MITLRTVAEYLHDILRYFCPCSSCTATESITQPENATGYRNMPEYAANPTTLPEYTADYRNPWNERSVHIVCPTTSRHHEQRRLSSHTPSSSSSALNTGQAPPLSNEIWDALMIARHIIPRVQNPTQIVTEHAQIFLIIDWYIRFATIIVNCQQKAKSRINKCLTIHSYQKSEIAGMPYPDEFSELRQDMAFRRSSENSSGFGIPDEASELSRVLQKSLETAHEDDQLREAIEASRDKDLVIEAWQSCRELLPQIQCYFERYPQWTDQVTDPRDRVLINEYFLLLSQMPSDDVDLMRYI